VVLRMQAARLEGLGSREDSRNEEEQSIEQNAEKYVLVSLVWLPTKQKAQRGLCFSVSSEFVPAEVSKIIEG
jgi:hypothetical protein